ncbi:MAG TPA: hypothetical protein PLA82_09885 [Deltaproteobacteria bacterium]|nr:hypothetical protein [Deltaproteobacteria bacterium]
MMINESVVIKRRFRGPPDSGNGGYVCGLLGQRLGGTAEVRLLRPPPLEIPLEISHDRGSGARLVHGLTVIAEARPTQLDLDVPDSPAFDEARTAMQCYVSEDDHFFPTCFVCGPARNAGDGLRIFPGPVAARSMVASAWVPDETLSDSKGLVRPEFVWASLDCPGAFAVLDRDIRPIVLGSLTAEILDGPAVGQRCIAAGWPISFQGRKRFASTALFSENGRVLARARAVWIEI